MRASSKDGSASTGREQLTRSGGARCFLLPANALVRRICFGGRKGRSAERRLRIRASRATVSFTEPVLTIGTPAYERWALFQARYTKCVTVAGPGGLWTFHGPPRGSSRAQLIAWFKFTRTMGER